MSFLEKIDKNKLPKHVAIIMDGNGRWAKQRNLDRTFGHKAGIDSVRDMIEAAREIGVPYMTLYTFSTENWNRPAEEIDTLMSLMVQSVVNETPDLIKNGIRLTAIGDIDRLPEDAKNALNSCIQDTAHCQGLILVLALSYSSKWEIVRAFNNISKDLQKGILNEIDETTITNYLTTKNIPDPDLLIRTGGEKRISNFLLWQIAYSELYFTDILWPDFRKESFFEAIVDYQTRERRFGKTSEQIKA